MEEKVKIKTIILDKKSIQEFHEEIKGENDRATVILGAAKLDFLLYQLLIKVLLPNTSSRDDLFDGEAPLSSFSAKIRMAHRLGLIDSDLTRALHLLRKIRNSFAHESSKCTLNSGIQRNQVKEFIAPLEKLDKFREFQADFFGIETDLSIEFRAVLLFLEMLLEIEIKKLEPIKMPEPISLIPPYFYEE